jgi:hypothetical protein
LSPLHLFLHPKITNNDIINTSLKKRTPQSTVLFRKLIAPQPVMNQVLRNRRFITHFLGAASRPCPDSDEFSLHPHIFFYTIIQSFHLRLGLPNGPFPSDFPAKICAFSWSACLLRICPSNLY